MSLQIVQIDDQFHYMKYLITVTGGYTTSEDMGFQLDENNQVYALDEKERYRILRKAKGTYETITPSEAILKRLEECRGKMIDDVRYYVKTGIFPQGVHSLQAIQILKQEQRLADIEIALANILGM